MLKKQLYMLIVCSCILQSFTVYTAEKNTYNPIYESVHKDDPVPKKIDIEDTLEDEFVTNYIPQKPSKTEKLLSLLAPYIITLLPYYLYLATGVASIKTRAAGYYTMIKHRKSIS